MACAKTWALGQLEACSRGLRAKVEFAELSMKDEYERTGAKQRMIDEFSYAAKNWPHERRAITRLEWGRQEGNPRLIVTNLSGDPQALYDQVYCQRGEAENRIEEAQIGLFATRTSCHALRSNQLRMLLAALGYVLIERLRALALQGTELAAAQVDTLRIELLKVAAVVTRNTQRIRLYLASNWPSAQVFAHAMSQLRSPLKRQTAPGRRDDTKMARNPSRGGGGTSRWRLRAIRASDRWLLKKLCGA